MVDVRTDEVAEIYRLVEVILVAVKLEIVVLPKLEIPETYKLVEVAPAPVMLVEINTVLVAKMLVLVTDVNWPVVKTPVDGVVPPIGVLLIDPPVIVRVPSTIASVTELVGNERAPETVKLEATRPVVVTLVTLM